MSDLTMPDITMSDAAEPPNSASIASSLQEVQQTRQGSILIYYGISPGGWAFLSLTDEHLLKHNHKNPDLRRSLEIWTGDGDGCYFFAYTGDGELSLGLHLTIPAMAEMWEHYGVSAEHVDEMVRTCASNTVIEEPQHDGLHAEDSEVAAPVAAATTEGAAAAQPAAAPAEMKKTKKPRKPRAKKNESIHLTTSAIPLGGHPRAPITILSDPDPCLAPRIDGKFDAAAYLNMNFD